MSSYGRQALFGMLFVAGGVVATKLSSLIAQFALGWLLAANDYKIWGMVVSLRMFVDGFRHGGALPVMQQQGAAVRDRAKAFFEYGLFFNVISALVLLVSVPLAQSYFRTGGLVWLIALMAVSLPLSTSGAFHRTRLAIDLRFSVIARVTSICAVVYYGLMVLCAVLGMGPYSFVLPLVVNALFEWWLYGREVSRVPHGSRLTLATFREIFRSSKWIIFAAIVTAVAMTGDYFVIGRLNSAILGEYLFGFQLTVALSVVIAVGFQQVMLPTFSKLQGDSARLAEAYRKSVLMTSLVAAPFFALTAAFAPIMMHLLWSGKWDAAIPVVQVMSLCLMLRLLNSLSASALQAVGRWDLFAISMSLDATAVVIAAWVGTQVGGLPATAIAVGIGRCLVVPVMIVVTARVMGLSAWRIVGQATVRVALPIVSVCVTWIVLGFPGDITVSYAAKALLGLFFAEAVTLWLFRADLKLIRNLVSNVHKTGMDEDGPSQ